MFDREPLTIALDMQAARRERTGIGAYAAELAAALPAPGLTILPIDWGRDPVMRLPRRLQWQQWELPRRAAQHGAAVLHCTGFDAPRRASLPVVLTVHDLIGMVFPHNLPPVARWYWSRWLPRSVWWADHIIADSAWTRHDVMRLLGVPSDRISVVPLAADVRFAPQPPTVVAALRERLGLPDRIVLYVGTLEPRKGLDTLVQSWAALAANFPDTRLVIGGKVGWYTERLHALIADLGLAERVQFLGYVAAADLPALYAAAEVFVFPSCYEGFGLPPLEAMQTGTPVITTTASSLPEVVADAGLLVPPDAVSALAHAISLVLTQPTLAAELRRRGLQRATAFSWSHTAQLTRVVYAQVVAEARQRQIRI